MPRARLAAMGAAKKKNADGSSGEMDTSMSVLGKRTRTIGGIMEPRTAAYGNTEKRQSSKTLQIALAVELEVVKEHAQWRDPELKPEVDARQSSVVEGVDGAVSAWVEDGSYRELGQGLSPGGEEQRAALVQAAKIKEPDA